MTTKDRFALFDDLERVANADVQETLAKMYYSSVNSGAPFHEGRYTALRNLVPGLRKRFIGETKFSFVNESDRHEMAIKEFLDDNHRCGQYNLFGLSLLQHEPHVAHALGEATRLMTESLERAPLNYGAVSQHMRIGPGSSSGVKGDPCVYNRWFAGAISSSDPSVMRTFNLCMHSTPLGYQAQVLRRQLYGKFDTTHVAALFSSVPKTGSKNRGICSQPSANMALQLATHRILCGVLKNSFDCSLDAPIGAVCEWYDEFSTALSPQQDLNKDLALLGSLGRVAGKSRSWNFVTLDLKSASNFPWTMICQFLPLHWKEWLNHIRSSEMQISPGVVVKKHMCSTMGNGFTFALMTLLFSSIVKSLYIQHNIPEYDTFNGVRRKTWAVYGDDIIVDKLVLRTLLSVLNALGARVNEDKSCLSGFFRESCGGDFYRGYPTRPVFCEELRTDSDIYSLINRLNMWSAMHSCPLKRSVSLLLEALSTEYRCPNHEDVCSGLHVPFSHHRIKASRYSSAKPPAMLELEQIYGGTSYACLLPTPLKKALFTEYTRMKWPHKDPNLMYFDSDGDYVRNKRVVTKWYTTFYLAAMYSMLYGECRQGQINIRRPGGVKYHPTYRYTPSWGLPIRNGMLSTNNLEVVHATASYRLWEEQVRQNTF